METLTPYSPAPDRYDHGMTYRRCGRSGVLLPSLSLGLWQNFGLHDDPATARALLRHAFDRGITHFDLANNYGPPPGAAEEFFGHVLRTDFKAHRDELFISTKAGYDMWPGPYGSWGSRKHLLASLDQSLSRLGMDYVDLFYSHRFDPVTPLEETLEALVTAVRSGRALYVGLSRWPLEAARFGFDYLRRAGVPCLLYQGRLNLLDQAPLDEGILPAAADAGTGFISFSPLAQGLLTDRYLDGIPAGSRVTRNRFLKADALTADMLRRIQRLNSLAAERGQTLARMALEWILQQPGVTSVLVGASSIAQLDKNLLCVAPTPFSEEEQARLEEILESK